MYSTTTVTTSGPAHRYESTQWRSVSIYPIKRRTKNRIPWTTTAVYSVHAIHSTNTLAESLIPARAHCRMHSTPSPLCLWRVTTTTTITRRRCINVRADVCLADDWCSARVRVRVCVRIFISGTCICIGHFNSMVMAEQIVVLILLLLQNRLSICSDLFAILTQYDRLISRLLRWYIFLCVVFSLLFNLIFS